MLECGRVLRLRLAAFEAEVAMFAVLYRWRVDPEKAAEFVRQWELVTTAIRDQCGSFGSRLHRTEDGEWVAYARWPDLETLDRCSQLASIPVGPMLALIDDPDRYPPVRMSIELDLLQEPGSQPQK